MIATLLRPLVTVLQIILFIYVILLSFFPSLPDRPLVRIVVKIAEVLILPARKLFQLLGMERGMRPSVWTPLFTIFLLNIAEALVLRAIYG